MSSGKFLINIHFTDIYHFLLISIITQNAQSNYYYAMNLPRSSSGYCMESDFGVFTGSTIMFGDHAAEVARRGVWNKKHISYRKKLVQNEKSPLAYHVEFTQCASGLVSIILLLLFQLPLYISFYKRRYHKASYCGGHHFSDTQNIFGS